MFCASLYLLFECGVWCVVCGLRGAVCGLWCVVCAVRGAWCVMCENAKNDAREKSTDARTYEHYVSHGINERLEKNNRFSFRVLCWDKCHWSADFLFFIRWNCTWPEILSIFCVWTRDTLSNVINYNFFNIFASSNIAQTALSKNCIINQIQL
jgi:hypothetical protein